MRGSFERHLIELQRPLQFRANASTSDTSAAGPTIQSRQIGRVRLSDFVAHGGQVHVYAVMGIVSTLLGRRGHPSRVYRSVDEGRPLYGEGDPTIQVVVITPSIA